MACNNITGRQNIYGYNYANQPSTNGSFEGMPQVQTADRFFFIGVFWTLSKSKNANMLNNL